MIRFFDIVFSILGILILIPVFIIVYIIIILESKGGGFYLQQWVGKNGSDFKLYKFRTMAAGADKKGLLTVGGSDARITKTGGFLRRFKLDELPQLFNVLIGDMSLVGPRPEVRKYVDLYSPLQRTVLSVQPGITDYASIEFVDENTLLGLAKDPENAYINNIMPEKIRLNLRYIQNKSVKEYFRVIFLTLQAIVKRNSTKL